MAVTRENAGEGFGSPHDAALPRPRRALGARLQDGLVALYVAAGLLALAPGLLARWQLFDASSDAGALLQSLAHALQPIAFGHTLRFWLGVTGATMLALLLLYPILKVFGSRGAINIARLFHVHAMFGVAGPVLILYHCNFGTGSTPANVALASTLVIALSGIFGHFVYRRTSAGFHHQKRESERRRDAIAAEAQALRHSSSRAGFLDELAAYDRHAFPDRSAQRRLRPAQRELDERRHQLVSRAGWLIDNQGPQEDWSERQCREAKARLEHALEAYFKITALASRRGGADRLTALWRLLHLPLFCILLIAAGIHVSKVWNLDGASAADGSMQAAVRNAEPPSPRRASLLSQATSPIATRNVATLVEGPALGAVARPLPAEPSAQRAPEPGDTSETGQRSVRVIPIPRGGASPATGTTARPKIEPLAADPVAQLLQAAERATPAEPLDPVALHARLAELRKDPTFDHARNRFQLVGKHREVACEKCHKTTLRETNQSCAGCHRQDDVHRGRRPQCESCHTAADWGEIKRR